MVALMMAIIAILCAPTDARDFGDDKLADQLVFLKSIFQIMKTAAQVLLKRLFYVNEKTDACDMLTDGKYFQSVKDLRAKLAKATTVAKSFGEVKMHELFAPGAGSHLAYLDGVTNALNLHNSLISQSQGLLTSICEDWAEQLTKLCELIDSMCPKLGDASWQVKEDQLLENHEYKKVMLQNPHYEFLGPACEHLSAATKLFKDINNDGCGAVLTPEQHKLAKDMVKLGSSTVATTFALYNLTEFLPSIANATKRKSEAELVREQLRNKHVKLTPSMKSCLDSFTNGTWKKEEKNSS